MLGGIALARLTAAFAQEAMRCMGMLMPFAQGDPEALIRIKTSNREEIMTIHRTFVAPHRSYRPRRDTLSNLLNCSRG